MKVKVKVGSENYETDVEKELRIDRNKLDEELATQASLLGHFGVLAEVSRGLLERKKLELDVLGAELDAEYRRKFTENGGRFTEKMVAGAVTLDKRWLKVAKEKLDLEKQTKELSALVEAFRQRGMSLSSIARLRASELMQTELTVNK